MNRSLILTVPLLCFGLAATAPAKPNVVIILADDLGWADVSYHAQRCRTPNIDKLVRQGVELDHFYVAPMCSPTRAGLMTGRYPIRFGLARAVIPPYRNFGLPVEERTIAEYLAPLGYQRRGVFGKWHLGHHQAKWHPLAQGFTHFEGHYNGAIDYFTHEREGQRDWHIGYEPNGRKGYSTDLIAQAAAEFIDRSAGDESPYFCYVAFNAPHSPFQAKPADLRGAGVAEGARGSVEEILRAMISSLDQGIGRVLKAIEDTGEANDTQVWFMSDNGGIGRVKANNLPLRGNKLSAFEGGIRVPACVRWPSRWKGGRKLGQTMGYIDVLPTILATAGGKPRDSANGRGALDGVSLVDLLSGRSSSIPERNWYTYHGQAGPQQEHMAVKTADWKLVVQGPDLRRGGLTAAHTTNLFRMPDDALEKSDVAQKHPDVVRKLAEKLAAHRRLQPANGVIPYRQGRAGFVPPKNWRITPTPSR